MKRILSVLFLAVATSSIPAAADSSFVTLEEGSLLNLRAGDSSLMVQLNYPGRNISGHCGLQVVASPGLSRELSQALSSKIKVDEGSGNGRMRELSPQSEERNGTSLHYETTEVDSYAVFLRIASRSGKTLEAELANLPGAPDFVGLIAYRCR